MTNEEKSVGIGLNIRDNLVSLGVKRGEVEAISLVAQKAAMAMANWKDKQYKVLIDYIVEFLNNSGYDCETFCECMPEWCEKNCGSHNPNFNEECIINWIKKQNEIKL